MKFSFLSFCCLIFIGCQNDTKNCNSEQEIYEKYADNKEIVKTVDCANRVIKTCEIIRFNKDSIVYNGEYKEFFDDGSLHKIGFFKMNIQDSIAIVYRKDGSKELDNYRVNGALKGFQNYYDRNNKISSRNYFINDSQMIFKIFYNENGSIKSFEGRALFIFYDKEPNNLKVGERLFIGNEVPIVNELITELYIKLTNAKGEKKVDVKTQSFQYMNNAYFKGVMFTPSAKGSYNYSAIVTLINKSDHSVVKVDTMSLPINVR